MIPNDTSPEAERVQVELLRRATTAQRAGMALALSHQALALSQRAIRRANPDLPEREIERIFVTLHYGEDIYNKLVRPRLPDL